MRKKAAATAKGKCSRFGLVPLMLFSSLGISGLKLSAKKQQQERKDQARARRRAPSPPCAECPSFRGRLQDGRWQRILGKVSGAHLEPSGKAVGVLEKLSASASRGRRVAGKEGC